MHVHSYLSFFALVFHSPAFHPSEPRDFESLRIEMPDKKRPYLLSSLPKTFTLKEIKAAFIVLHNIPISEKRAAEVAMYAL